MTATHDFPKSAARVSGLLFAMSNGAVESDAGARALARRAQLIAVSESNVRAFSLADLDVAHQTADLSIGTCTTSEPPYPSSGGFVRDDYSYACSVSAAHGGGQSGLWLLALLALALLRLQRRCRSRRA